ncbi:Fusaric acid resistance protein-like-domain-containing protein [Fennellomyces sp. T-0311]|nr:Fusaric acid resistance protein-like-domain-containing protein [Fennellomyces sp. T-0311]
MEKRQGYFDLSVGDDASQDARPQQLPGPRIFTIEPSISSLEDDDHKTEVPSNNNGNNQGPPNDEKPRVQFRPKLEYIGRVYSTAASVTTLDDQPRSRKERAINFLHRRFPTRIVRRVLKCTLAYFISTLFSLINPVAQALGTSASMTTAGMLFNHPGRTMGAQFDSTLTSALGICCGMGFCFAGLACSVAYNVRHPDTIQYGAIINALFLFLGIFSAQMLRQFYPRFFFFSLQAMIMFIFNFSTIPGMGQTVLPKDLPLQIGLPLLCGAAISQLVNLCVWPETAVEGLGRALKETSKSSKEMLDMITKQFFLDPESEMVPGEVVDETAEKMRKGMTKVKTAYKEAKYEISYTYIRPYELGNIQKSLDRLTKHLNILGGSLKTERVLFETAIASLHAAEAASSTDEDTDSSDSTDDEHQLTHPHDEPRKSTLRWLTNEDELDLRRAAMLAAGHSPQNSRPNSRIGSRAGSRAGSRRNSLDDTDHEDQNQKSVSSLRSFLNLAKLSSPAPKPPRKKNRHLIEHGDGELLVTYLESLRDPLMRLSMECAPVLDCVSHSIEVELDMDDDDDKSIWKTWKAYIFHTFKIKKRKKNEEPKKSKYKHEPKDCDCAKTMSEAIKRFDKTEGDRMHTLYKLNMSRIGNEVLDLGMREELFLVFFFIFSLRQVATELESMAKAMDELRSSRPDRRRRHLYMPQFTQKWWRKWASSNDHQSVRDKGGYSLSNLQPAIPKDDRKVDATEEYRLRRIKTSETFSGKKARRMSSVASQTSSNIAPNLEKLSSTMTLRRQRTNTTKNSSQLSPPVEDHELSAMEAAMENKEPEIKPPLILRIRYSTWQSLQFLKKYEFKFALKMGLAVLGLSIPAFIPASMYWYSNSVRGQWACMTIIAIMNPTSGGTFEASFWRIVGTLTGALAGWAALEADGGSPYLLALFAVLLSIPFFYMHLASTFNKVGTVVLMTYMAVALSRYVQSPDEPISETVWKRTATVVVGILVAVSLNWVIWPFVARHAVRKSISGTIGELGDYYTYLMGTFLFNELQASDDDVKKAQKIESKIQKSIDACAVLLELTDHEPRLKGPFPKDFYKEMIVSTRNILDRLLSMRTALISMPSSVKKDICLQDYNVYRRDMTASMLLHFYTLQSSLNSKIPLPAYMPSARSARTRLIRYRRKEAKSTQQFVRFKNLCWFAMASSTEEIIEELEHLNDLIRFIVGESKYADRARRIDALL